MKIKISRRYLLLLILSLTLAFSDSDLISFWAKFVFIYLIGILGHELAHMLTAFLLGLRVSEFQLDLMYGLVGTPEMYEYPNRATVIAVAGPAFNVVLLSIGLVYAHWILVYVSGYHILCAFASDYPNYNYFRYGRKRARIYVPKIEARKFAAWAMIRSKK